LEFWRGIVTNDEEQGTKSFDEFSKLFDTMISHVSVSGDHYSGGLDGITHPEGISRASPGWPCRSLRIVR
jgi:hypothetical protein